MKTGYSQLLDQAMQAQTQEQADAILQKLVTACIIAKPMSEEAALAIQRENLGYYAGFKLGQALKRKANR